MDEWNPKLAWLIGAAALLATGLIIVLAWPAVQPQIQEAMRASSQAQAPVETAGGGAAPAITENRTVGNSRVHRID